MEEVRVVEEEEDKEVFWFYEKEGEDRRMLKMKDAGFARRGAIGERPGALSHGAGVVRRVR
jgi:hypothetical protein